MPTQFSGDKGEGATPVPIPNTVVKTFSADGTAWVTAWESRTLPEIYLKGVLIKSDTPFLFFLIVFMSISPVKVIYRFVNKLILAVSKFKPQYKHGIRLILASYSDRFS